MIDHSFVVMAYKDSPYLSECLISLRNQTIQSNIYIATSTPSPYILETGKKYGVDVFITEPGKGIAHDWNFSLQLAKTKYVTLAHQDDFYFPEFTEYCYTNAEKYKDTIISFTAYIEIVNNKERDKTLLLRIKSFMLWFFMPFQKKIESNLFKKLFLSVGNPISAPGVMYNLQKLSGFQFSKEFSINLDWEAWYRMAEMSGKFIFVDKILFKHRIHLDSATTSGLETNLRQTEDLKMFNLFWPRLISRVLLKLYARSYRSNNDLNY